MTVVKLWSRIPEIIAAGGSETWSVSNAVEHTIYNEFGTVSMSAQPMLHPSVEVAREPFEQAIEQAYTRGVPVARVVEKTAMDIRAGCQVRSRVDTGQMKGGWVAEPVE